MIRNGYEISGNLAAQGRLYRVTNSAGAVVQTTNSKRLAVDWCDSQSAGDVKEFVDVKPLQKKTTPKTFTPRKDIDDG